MNISELNYETIVDPFDNLMEREGGLFGAPGLVDLESVNEYNEKTTKEIIGDDLENLWIKSWIKSRSYKPGSSGFKLDGKTGKITCKLLEVTGGTISYNKTSFTDSANAGYYIGSEGLYFGATADANYLKYNINTADFTLHGVNVSHPTITGIQSGSEISIQGWQQDMTFSATDADTVAWTSGTITLLDGTTYSITGANTGNIVALTYIYLDIGTSTTALQTTTTASNAVGSGKILIAVAENNSDATSKATYQVFGGKGGNMLAVDNIAANSASVNEFVSNSAQIANTIIGNAHITGTILVGHTEADVTQTIIDGGIITTGYITLNTAGHIKSGKASYADTAAGWWLGKDSTTPKFNIGTATKYFKWDGTNITWKGANTELDASGNLIASSVTVSGAVTTGAGSTINGTYIDSLNANKINVGTLTGFTIISGVIKTASTNKRVELNSTGNLNEIAFYNADNTLSGKFYGAGSEIQGGPWLFLTAKTYIDGAVLIDGGLTLHGSGDQTLTLRDGITDLTWMTVADASPYNIQVNRSFIPYSANTCNLGNSTYKWQHLYLDQDLHLDSNQGVWWGGSYYLKHDGSYFRVNDDFLPSSSNIRNLGTSGNKWKHLYLDQNLYMDSGQYIYWNGTAQSFRHDGTVFRINDDLQPTADGTYRLGYTNIAWYAVHSDNYLGCNLPTSNSGIGIFKKIKKPKIEDGKAKGFHAGKRHYFNIDEFPDEMKMTDKDSGEKDIELTRTIGVTVSAVRELVEEIDLLKNRLKLIEKKTI